MRRLHVWWDEQRVGELTQDDHGDLGFIYSPDYLARDKTRPLSRFLPKRTEPFTRRECRPFFGGLLPEEGTRDAVASALGVSRANDFSLLDSLGGDVAGALQLLPDGATPRGSQATHGGASNRTEALDEDALIAVLDALPKRPFLAGDEGLRLSLAGAQPKIPVVLVDGAIALPAEGQPTTHILKPPIARFPATTENEAFVMRLAAACGLLVARVEARVVRERSFLLVERYDRAIANGRTRRIHQEDFCQALGVPPERKYAREKGPTFRDCFALVRAATRRPAEAVLGLLDAAIFNFIAGNADAHGKNFSLLHADGGTRIAPLYDLLMTVAYPELSPGFAMKVGKRATLTELETEAWKAFAEEGGLSFPLVRRRVRELCEAVAANTESVATALMAPGLDAGHLSEFAATARARAERCAFGLKNPQA